MPHQNRKRKLLAFSLLLILSLHPPSLFSSAQNVTVSFPSFSLRNFSLLGDSHLRSDGVLGLTRETGVPSSSAGTAIFDSPIRLRDSDTNTTASFSTEFSFSVANANPNSSSGDGLSFFLSPEDRILGSPGGYLGLVNASQLTKNKFLAVEFDTKMDLHFNDPSDNHVGFDIESLDSIETADPMISQGIDLKSGIVITSWIDYDSPNETLSVFLSYSTSKPAEPILTVHVSLSGYLKDEMFAGFSGSTEGSTEQHFVENWTFRTRGLPRPRVPHNVSDATVVTPNPIKNGPEEKPRRRRKRIGLWLGFVIGGPVLVFIPLVLVLFRLSSRKNKKSLLGFSTQEFFASSSPREFTFKELKSATRGFHPSRVLGRGAFGTVYKASFASTGETSGATTEAAVKRSRNSGRRRHEDESEFLSELSIIACLRHKNLVQLRGWCVEKDELLLVYDFMPNGSLDKVLYSTDSASVLSWQCRRNIAVGLAAALTYLHRECDQKVIHRDVKTGNVLLDEGFNPRLSDFGLAKLTDHDKSPVSTLTAGTMGYLAPEYLQYGKATEMTDVFSFGVVILEVACGRRPIVEKRRSESETLNLVDWVWNLHSKGDLVSAADPRLGGEFERDEMARLLLVGLGCANPDSEARPTMRRALQILSHEAEPIPVPPSKPTLTFSCSLAYSLSDIVSDQEEDADDSSQD